MQFCVYWTLQDVQKVLQVCVSSSPAVSPYCFLFLIPWHGETKVLPLDSSFTTFVTRFSLDTYGVGHFCSTTTSVYRRAGGKCSCSPPLCFTAAEVTPLFFFPTTTPRHRNTALHVGFSSSGELLVWLFNCTLSSFKDKLHFYHTGGMSKKKSLLYAHYNKNVDVQLSINRYDQGRMQNRGGCLSSDNLCNIFQRPFTMSVVFNLPKQILRYNEKPRRPSWLSFHSSLCYYTKFKLTFSSSCAPSSMQMCFYIPHLSSSAVTFKGGVWIQTVWFASRFFYSESVLYSQNWVHRCFNSGAFFFKPVQTTISREHIKKTTTNIHRSVRDMKWKSIFS